MAAVGGTRAAPTGGSLDLAWWLIIGLVIVGVVFVGVVAMARSASRSAGRRAAVVTARPGDPGAGSGSGPAGF